MAVKTPIYVDNNATTPVDPRVLEAMLPYFGQHFGNAASLDNALGRQAADAVDKAREQVAAVMNAAAEEIIFTSGATESVNLAIKGVAESCRGHGDHIITCATEHKAVLDTCEYLTRHGFSVTFLRPDGLGLVTLEQVTEALTDRTILITLMTANNETGAIQPAAKIAALAGEKGVPFHTDATQTYGRLPVDVQAMGVDLLSLSGHKIYGPKGVGALYVRGDDPRVRPATQMHGGGHEGGLRSGTLNVPGIVGLGAAAEICGREMDREAPRLTALRDRLHRGLTEALDGVRLNGHPTRRLPNTLNVSFAGVKSESLMMKMPEVAVSSGSACTSGVPEPSHVLKAMGVGDSDCQSAIRFSLGRFNTQEEVDFVVRRVVQAVSELRDISFAGEASGEAGDSAQARPAPRRPGRGAERDGRR